MARYIDLENSMVYIGGYTPDGYSVYHVPSNTPTADVVERKRGKWETEIRTIRGHKIHFPFCSVCGKYTICEYIYCPNCGAEMERSE